MSINVKESLEFKIEEIADYSNGQINNDNNVKEQEHIDSLQDYENSFEENDKESSMNQSAMHLIEFHKKGLQLNPKAIEFIQSIEDDIVIVSIVGKARTGKSYLMNLLLNNQKQQSSMNNTASGFQVASTINSCTRGIWLWGTPKSQPNSTAKILFIDSEGTNSVDLSTKTYDAKIFALVVLISSLFIYNTTGNIDEKSISDLSLAAHLSSAIAGNSKINQEALITDLSPKFIWVLRDFTLDKVDPDTNEEISSKAYLEMCLRNKTSGKNSADNNVIRENILKYFKERDCFTLPRPCESEEQLQKLNTVPFKELKSTFRSEFIQLKNTIYKDTKPKRINSRRINGPALAQLITLFINAINAGCVPNISNAWDSIVESDIKESYAQALKYFKDNSSHINAVSYESNEFLRQLYSMKYKAMMIYEKVVYVNYEINQSDSYQKIYVEYRKMLSEGIDKTIDQKKKVAKEMIISIARNQYENDMKKINGKIYSDAYAQQNGHLILIEDYDDLLKKYDKGTCQVFDNENCLELLVKKDGVFTQDAILHLIGLFKGSFMKELCQTEMKMKGLDHEADMFFLPKLEEKCRRLKEEYDELVKIDVIKERQIDELREKQFKLMEQKKNMNYTKNNDLMMSLRKSHAMNGTIQKNVFQMEGEEPACQCSQACIIM